MCNKHSEMVIFHPGRNCVSCAGSDFVGDLYETNPPCYVVEVNSFKIEEM